MSIIIEYLNDYLYSKKRVMLVLFHYYLFVMLSWAFQFLRYSHINLKNMLLLFVWYVSLGIFSFYDLFTSTLKICYYYLFNMSLWASPLFMIFSHQPWKYVIIICLICLFGHLLFLWSFHINLENMLLLIVCVVLW